MPDSSAIVSRDLVFDRVRVDYTIPQGARVTWTMHRNFVAEGDYEFQLQVATTGGTPTASNWTDVGLPQVNAYVAIDNVRRLYAKEWDLFYRVKLTLEDDTVFYSEPCQPLGILGRRDWLLVRDMIRVKRLELRLFTGWEGYLLKRMRDGVIPDPWDLREAVTDPITGEILTTHDSMTMGTEFVGGFFDPVLFYLDMTPETHYAKRGDAQRHTIDPDLLYGVCPAFPYVATKDVFVHAHSDRRYSIEQVRTLTQHRGVPVFVSVGLRLLPASDIVYSLEIEP